MESLIKKISKVARNSLTKDFSLSLEDQFDSTRDEISKFENDAIIVCASEETIKKYEDFMGLEYNSLYTLEDRIDRVVYTLQSKGGCTPQFIKEQSLIFNNGKIEIEELFNKYHFNIKFVSEVGVPKNLKNYEEMIKLNKPAHLTYEFIFRYNTHGELKILRHSDMKNYTHKQLFDMRVFEDRRNQN